jgi:hypothetical protein
VEFSIRVTYVPTQQSLGGHQTIEPGLYRHYKGGLYAVLAVARHSETEEVFVIYRAYQGGQLWIRPLSMFSEQVLINDRWVPRFEHVIELPNRQGYAVA